MPGPVSDSYDSEWGTAANGESVKESLRSVYKKLSGILDNMPPMYVLDLVVADLPSKKKAFLTEKEWRLLRFCVERAIDSI